MARTEEQRAKQKEYMRAWWAKRKQDPVRAARERERCLEKALRLRTEVVTAYGGKCVCCGETEVKFLSLDHIIPYSVSKIGPRRSVPLYCWLKKNGFPKGIVQLLCHNCNFSKGLYGACPHTIKKEAF